MKKVYTAFTLAEVLITLAIIGVVAAITIPVLMNNIQDYQFKQTWKKEFSVISQAYLQLKNDESGDLSQYFSPTATRAPAAIVVKLGNYLSFVSNCSGQGFYSDYEATCATEPPSSLVNAYKDLTGNYFNQVAFNCGQYILADGSQIYFRTYNPGNYFTIWVDVNGYKKGPNMAGKDLFGAVATPQKVIPMGASGTGLENTCQAINIFCPSAYGFDDSGSKCAGAGCSAEYLYN